MNNWKYAGARNLIRNLYRNTCLMLLVIAIAVQGLIMAPMPSNASSGAGGPGYLDKIEFGNASSEQEHQFAGEFTKAITGALGETARVSQPQEPQILKGGDLTFRMKVDPIDQNYFTVKFWGEDITTHKAVVHINGEQIGVFREGDYALLNGGVENAASGHIALPNRFFYATTMLPLKSTLGQDTVEITITTYSSNFESVVTTESRGYYNAYTHTQPYLDVSDETQGIKIAGDLSSLIAEDTYSEGQKQELIDGYTASQVTLFNDYSQKVDGSASAKLSIERYQDELRFYATALHYDWVPAQTPELKKQALQRIFKTIDNHVKDYYGNIRLIGTGGHQSDWGGFYGALGEALYIAENFILDEDVMGIDAFNEFLDQPFDTGTVAGEYSLPSADWEGGTLSRREAWERTLKANFDFARSRLSYIYNQVMYTYEGAWEAHEGLRIVGSPFYEGQERSRQILLESLGAQPFLGEEVLAGPNGEELDLYHSLFYHDRTAQYTQDYLQIVMKGYARSKLDNQGEIVRRMPLGQHFTGITEAGLTRENGYVANYGESSNYLPEHFYRLFNNGSDPVLADAVLKLALTNLHARGYTRYTALDENGKRIMRMEMVLDERNPAYPGNTGYAIRVSEGKTLLYASLEKHMADHEERYVGEDWDTYWDYAREAVGYAQQQMADNQYFNRFSNVEAKKKVDYRLADTYNYVTGGRAEYDRFDSAVAGVVHPLTDFDYYLPEEIEALGVDPAEYEQVGWADIDNMLLTVRDGDTRLMAQLNMRNRGFTGNGRLHVINDTHDQLVQIATNAQFRYEDYYLRMNDNQFESIEDQVRSDLFKPSAVAGYVAPITYQPGVGTVNRDNFEVDHAYSSYPDLLKARYGPYLMAINTTRELYENEQTFDIELPADFTGTEVLDLISGKTLQTTNGRVQIKPKTAVVLKLSSNTEQSAKPSVVHFASALAGNGYAGITWEPASGAASYTLKRSDSENGTYTVIATGVQGTYYKDNTVTSGNRYFYKVAAVNEHGAGWDSYRSELNLTAPASLAGGLDWRDDRIGAISTGSATVKDNAIAISGGNGSGLGEGDDYILEQRATLHDSLHFVHQQASGSHSISTRIAAYDGTINGLMMRDLLESSTRYIYFGADEEGKLVLQNRTRDTRHAFSDKKASPLNVELNGYMAEEFPYVKLTRESDRHTVQAYVSRNGLDWKFVASLFTPFPYTIYSGVVTDKSASFQEVALESFDAGTLLPFVERSRDKLTLGWNKPKQAIRFDVFRTDNPAAFDLVPQFKPGTRELEDDSPWELAASAIDRAQYTEAGFTEGIAAFKVAAYDVDGFTGTFSDATVVAADSIYEDVREAESLQADAYTRLSYYLFMKELEQIKKEISNPAIGLDLVSARLNAALGSLVSSDTISGLDDSLLVYLLQQYDELEEELYTKASWAKLRLAAVKAESHKEEAVEQQTIDTAANDFEAALNERIALENLHFGKIRFNFKTQHSAAGYPEGAKGFQVYVDGNVDNGQSGTLIAETNTIATGPRASANWNDSSFTDSEWFSFNQPVLGLHTLTIRWGYAINLDYIELATPDYDGLGKGDMIRLEIEEALAIRNLAAGRNQTTALENGGTTLGFTQTGTYALYPGTGKIDFGSYPDLDIALAEAEGIAPENRTERLTQALLAIEALLDAGTTEGSAMDAAIMELREAIVDTVGFNDASLGQILVNGSPIGDFAPDKTEYKVHIPYSVKDLPVITAQSASGRASVHIAPAASLPGKAVVTVTAPDQTTVRTYNIYLNQLIEAESATGVVSSKVSNNSGASGGQLIDSTRNGHYFYYDNIDLSYVTSLNFRASRNTGSAPATLEARLGSETGELIGTATVPLTGNWNNFVTVNVPIEPVAGTHNIYLVVKVPDNGWGVNFDWFSLENDGSLVPEVPVHSTAGLTAPSMAYIGQDLDLSLEASGLSDRFSILEMVVDYDPATIEFDTVMNDNGTPDEPEDDYAELAPGTITAIAAPLGVVASAVKPEQGEVFILLSAEAALENGELLDLHARVKNDASPGTTSVTVQYIKGAKAGVETALELNPGTAVIAIAAITDRTALQAVVNEAGQLYGSTTEGTLPGQYPPAARQSFELAIQSASDVLNKLDSTEQEIGDAAAQLTTAIATYRSAVIPVTPEPVLKEALIASIQSARHLHQNTAEGNKIGQYASSKADLWTAITTAEGVRDLASATQIQVDTAVTALNQATQNYMGSLVTLVPGQTKVSIRDLSIVAKYYGTTSTDSEWDDIAVADAVDQGEINIVVLAYVAKLIINEWLAE